MILHYVKTYEEVLKQIDEVSLAHFYLSMKPNKFYYSLFRKDSHPSASLYYNKQGRLQYNDFVYHFSLPYAIMQFKGWDHRTFFINVTRDFNLKSNSSEFDLSKPKSFNLIGHEIDHIKKETLIERKLRPFENHDVEFWNQFGIYKEWLQHPAVKVNPISHFWINNHKGYRKYYADKYAYCFDYFRYNNRYLRKIYQPYSKVKWISNIVSGEGGVCQLWETLPKEGRDLLIVTSSLKDGGTIYCNTFNIFNHNEGIYTIAPNNESGFLPDQIIPKLNDRFERIITWFDNDNAGIIAGKKYRDRYGWEPIYNPLKFKQKDPSDFRKDYGHREFISLFKYLVYGT